MKLPKITIITPSFNQGLFIEETIQSVITQSYPDIEYIIVDGGSMDNTIAIIKKYEKSIKWWISEKDKGQTHAINKGLARATGDIITWLNSDDILLPGALMEVAKIFINNKDIDFIHGASELFGTIKTQLKKANEEELSNRYLAYMPFPQPSSFFRKRIVEEQGVLDESLHYAMDFELLTRVALNYKIMSVPNVFSRYRIHFNSKSNQTLLFAKEWQQVFSRTLRSFNFSEKFIRDLTKLGLYHKGKEYYVKKNDFTFQDIQKTFCYFLEIQLHYHYQALELNKAREIAIYLKRNYYCFFENQQLGKILFRSTWLNKKMLLWLRRGRK